MALTKPAGCFLQLIGSVPVIGGILLLIYSHKPLGGIFLLVAGILIMWMGRQPAVQKKVEDGE